MYNNIIRTYICGVLLSVLKISHFFNLQSKHNSVIYLSDVSTVHMDMQLRSSGVPLGSDHEVGSGGD